MKKSLIAVILAILVLVSGCLTDEELEDLQQECRDTVFDINIPECDTQRECEKKFENTFDTDISNLSFETQEKFKEYKRTVADLWQNLNLFKKNLEKIENACDSTEEDFFSVANLQTVKDITTSIHLIEKKIQENYDITWRIAYAEIYNLEQLDINKLSNQKIYSTYRELIDIRNELQPPKEQTFDFICKDLQENLNKKDTKSFAFLYKKNICNLKQITDKLKIKDESIDIIVKNFIGGLTFDGYQLYKIPHELLFSNQTEVAIGIGTLFFDLFVENQGEFFEIIKNISIGRDLEILTIAFNGLSGTDNSMISSLMRLLNEESEYLKELNDLLEKDEKELAKIKSELQGEIEALNNTEYALIDEEFLSKLGIMWDSDLPIPANAYLDFSFELWEGEEKLRNQSNKTIGNKIIGAANVLGDFKELQKKVMRLKSYSIDSIVTSCEFYINETEYQIQKLESADLPKNFMLKYARIKNNISEFNKYKNNDKKLKYCKLVLYEYSNLDPQKHSGDASFLLDECLKNLEKSIGGNLAQNEYLIDYKKLKTDVALSENSQELLDKCLSIENSINKEIEEDPLLNQFVDNHNKTKLYLSKLEKLHSSNSEIIAISKFNNLSKDFSKQDSYFDNGKPLIQKIGPNLKSLYNESVNLLRTTKALFVDAIKSYFRNNYSVEIISLDIIETNKPNKQQIRVILDNWLEEIEGPISIELSYKNKGLTFLKSNSSHVITVNVNPDSILINFDKLPSQKIVLEFDASNNIITFQEKFELLQIEAKQAIFQKTIKLNNQEYLPKLLVSTNNNDLQTNDVFVYFHNRTNDFYFDENVLKIELEQVNQKDEVLIHFLIKNPLQVTKTLLSTKEIKDSVQECVFQIDIKNNLDFSISNPEIFVSLLDLGELQDEPKLFLNDSFVESREVSGKLNFMLPMLLPGKTNSFTLVLRIKNNEYWVQYFDKLKQSLFYLENVTYPDIRRSANSLSNTLRILENSFNSSSEKDVSELVKLGEKIEDLKFEFDDLQLLEAQYYSMSNKVEGELIKEKTEINRLEEGGFVDEVIGRKGDFEEAAGYVEDAKILAEEEKYEESVDNLKKASKKLKENNSNTITKQLKEKLDQKKEDFYNLTKKHEKYSLDTNLTILNESILSLFRELEDIIIREDYFVYDQKYVNLERQYEEANMQIFNSIKIKALETKEKFENLNEDKKGLEEIVSKWEIQLDSLGENELLEILDYTDITKGQISELKQNLKNIKKEFTDKIISNFQKMCDTQEYEKALDSLTGNTIVYDQINELTNQRNKLETSYDNIIDKANRILTDAKISYLNASNQNSFLENELKSAEYSLKNKKYLESLLKSSEVIRRVSLENGVDSSFEYPVELIYGGIGVVLLLGVLKFVGSKKNRGIRRIARYKAK